MSLYFSAPIRNIFSASVRQTKSFVKPQFIQSSRASYSTPSGNSPGGINKFLLFGAPALALSGYYYYTQTQPKNQKMSTSTPSTASLPISQSEFTPFKLKEIQEISHDTKRFRFEVPNSQSLGLSVASCVVTRKPTAEGEKPVIRPYTPTSPDTAEGYFDFIIKKYDTGAFTPYLFSLKVGDTLDIKGPFPKYFYKPNTLSSVGLVAGGTGITPMLQLIRKILDNPADKTKVSLIFANKTEQDILLKKELDQYAKDHPDRFKITYVLDNPSPSFMGTKGYVTQELLKKSFPGANEKDSMVFVCGPPPMVNSLAGPKKSPQEQGELVGYLKELGYTAEQVYKF